MLEKTPNHLERVSFAIQALLMFLNIAKESGVLSRENIRKREADSLDLLGEIKGGKIDVDMASLQLNEIIKKMNEDMEQYVPYPPFMTASPEIQLRTSIIAFEHYLNQELKTKHLSLQQEEPLFNESILLWERIGGSISAHEGEERLTSLIKRLNRFLPREEHYPTPKKQ